MGLGNNNSNSNQTLYVLRIKTKNSEGQKVPPFFQVLTKQGEEWVVQDNTYTSISGYLTKLEPKSREYDGEEIKSVNVYLQDGDEVFLLDVRYSILGRGIINSLINLEDLSAPVQISVYENKRGYEAGAVRSGDELVSWKFSLDEQPKPEEIKDKKGNLVKRDYSDVDAFFDAEVIAFAKKLGKDAPQGEKVEKKEKVKSSAKTAKQPVAVAEEGSEESDEPLF